MIRMITILGMCLSFALVVPKTHAQDSTGQLALVGVVRPQFDLSSNIRGNWLYLDNRMNYSTPYKIFVGEKSIGRSPAGRLRDPKRLLKSKHFLGKNKHRKNIVLTVMAH